jgi:uncharacterized protein (TIGR02246 family)
MHRHPFCVAMVIGITFASGSAPAQDPAVIRSRAQELVKTLSDGNAEAVAAFWTPSGEYSRGTVTIRGRDNIQKAYAEHFKKKPNGRLTIQDDSIRFLSDAVAMHEGTFVAERENPADSVRSKFSALLVNTDGKWYLGLLREESEGPTVAELSWMVGDWTYKTDRSEGTLSVQFTKKKTYLLIQTKVKDGDDEDTATQIIGIDPASRKLKSWTFESDGSIGTAEWVRTDSGWLASIVATAASGEQIKAVTTIKPSSRDEFTYQITERTMDGEKAPDIGPVKVTRAAKSH